MSKTRKVFIDTSAWIMLLNSDEDRHPDAVITYQKGLLNAEKYTSNMIIGETYTWLRVRIGYDPAMEFLKNVNAMLKQKFLTVIWSGPEIENSAADYLRKYTDHTVSYADAVSFAIMKSLDIQEAFTFDKHFCIAGFIPVNPL